MNTKKSVINDIVKAFASNEKTIDSVLQKISTMTQEERDVLKKIAALSDEDRSILIDYWKTLWGEQYSKDLVTDYAPRGKRKNVESSNRSITKQATLSGEDRSLVKNYYDNFYGDEYAKDMVEDYSGDGDSNEVEASSYNKLIKTYRKILGEETVNQLKQTTPKEAAKVIEHMSRNVKKKSEGGH
jgi:ribosomal protein S24E